jgi:hypothetical protein
LVSSQSAFAEHHPNASPPLKPRRFSNSQTLHVSSLRLAGGNRRRDLPRDHPAAHDPGDDFGRVLRRRNDEARKHTPHATSSVA